VIIRKTGEDDLDGITDMYQDPTSYEPHIWKVYLEKEPDLGIVAELHGKIVGCIYAYPHHDTVWIESLYVHPEYRRRGIGERLLKRAFSHIKRMGRKIALTDVRMDNASAIRLYKKVGFENAYVRSHLVAGVDTLSSKVSDNLNFHKGYDFDILWSIIINSDAYLTRRGIVMGCYRGWRLMKEDLKDFEVFTDDGKSIIIFREVVDLELAPDIHGIFEKRYSDSKNVEGSCPRFEINLISGNYTDSKKLLSYVAKRAKKEGANLIDIWTWREDPLFKLYNELNFENWGNLYLMERGL